MPVDGAAPEHLIDRLILAAADSLHDNQMKSVDLDDVSRRSGIDRDTVDSFFPDPQSLAEAVGGVGVARLADTLNRALVQVPEGDHRIALITLATAYLDWARANPRLYAVLTSTVVRPLERDSIVARYDASFVPLVCRFLEEPENIPSRRALMARSFLYGLADLTVGRHLHLWLPDGADIETELPATIADFVDYLLASQPSRTDDQPIRSDA